VADGVNVLGGPGALGAVADTVYAPASSAAVTLTNSLLRGFATALKANAGGSGTAHIAASYSDYDASNNVDGPGNASISQTNVSNVGDAGFADLSDGDYRLLPGSPLVDAGDPATGQGLDLRANPLVTDGDLDGTARRDIGAYELPAPLPAGGGAQPPTDGGQPPGGGDQGPVADRHAPLLSGFLSTHKVFAVARARTAISASVVRGTRFRYTVSEPARVTITIRRTLAGRRTGGRCVRPTARLRDAPRCARYRTIATLSRTANSGPNSHGFTGRIGSRALRPGRYRAVLRATDAAGNRSAPRAARFRVTRG
jgi:hypothetical protein